MIARKEVHIVSDMVCEHLGRDRGAVSVVRNSKLESLYRVGGWLRAKNLLLPVGFAF